MYKPELITTQDGSKTLYIPDINESYHSKFGAFTESKHVYIKNGINYLYEKEKQNITILEIGYGTGLNWFLTLDFALKNSIQLDYEAVEKFLIPIEILKEFYEKLYFEILNLNTIKYLISLPWNTKHELFNQINFLKILCDVQNFNFKYQKYDLVYYDAFAPNKQPEMWCQDIFEKIFFSLKKDGILVTYCAKGDFKRTLKKIGFKVESLPGPPYKKEMTRAIKI